MICGGDVRIGVGIEVVIDIRSGGIILGDGCRCFARRGLYVSGLCSSSRVLIICSIGAAEDAAAL